MAASMIEVLKKKRKGDNFSADFLGKPLSNEVLHERASRQWTEFTRGDQVGKQRSGKQRLTSKSSTESELIALASETDDTVV